jgi:hypothetical protein
MARILHLLCTGSAFSSGGAASLTCQVARLAQVELRCQTVSAELAFAAKCACNWATTAAPSSIIYLQRHRGNRFFLEHENS